MHAEMQITFMASRGTTEARLLQSKVQRILDAAIEAVVNAPCKALRRRVGQRLRKKLGKVLHQEEFEQALAVFKQRESELILPEEASLKEDSAESRDSPVHSPLSSTDPGSFSRQTTLEPVIANRSASSSSNLPCQGAIAIPVPVIAVPYFVPVLAAPPARAMPPQQLERYAEEAVAASPCLSVQGSGLELEKSSFSRSCTRTTDDASTSLSALDDEDDIADLSLDWIRAVSEGVPAPVERTFIQFNTKLQVNHRRSSSR